MKYDITIRVAADEKVIDIPWDDIKKDFKDFTLEKADPTIRMSLVKSLMILESRIRNVFLDRYKKFLIQ